MKIRLIDRELVDGRPRLTIQTRRWWQWSWRTEVWLRSRKPLLVNGVETPWWTTSDGLCRDWDWSRRLNRVENFAENEEKRTAQLLGDNVVPIRRGA